jgi:hypothetical protein
MCIRRVIHDLDQNIVSGRLASTIGTSYQDAKFGSLGVVVLPGRFPRTGLKKNTGTGQLNKHHGQHGS